LVLGWRNFCIHKFSRIKLNIANPLLHRSFARPRRYKFLRYATKFTQSDGSHNGLAGVRPFPEAGSAHAEVSLHRFVE